MGRKTIFFAIFKFGSLGKIHEKKSGQNQAQY